MKLKFIFLLIFIEICSSILISNPKDDDKELCKAQTDANKCKFVQLTSTDLQCCQYSYKLVLKNGDKKEDQSCHLMINPIDYYTKEYINSKQVQALYREETGYLLVGEIGEKILQISEMNTVIDCNDGAFNLEIGSYNNDDYSILTSGEHCLKYDNTKGLASEDLCLNSKVLKKSANIGITCAYYEYHVKINGQSTTYRKCDIFDRNIYNTKKVDNLTKDEIESYVYSSLNLDYESFDVYITGVKNKQLVYYSTNSSIVYDGPGEEIVPIYPESSSFLSLKYLLALFFLLLL